MNETTRTALATALARKQADRDHAAALLAAAVDTADQQADTRRHLFDKTSRLDREISELQASIAERGSLSLCGDGSPRP